jgi:predicted N-acyltransferase
MTAIDTGNRFSEVVRLSGARDIGRAEWDRLARRGYHLHHWCATAEASGWQPRHVAVQHDGVLQAIVPAYLTGSTTLHDLHARWLGPLANMASAAGINLRPILSVQAPFASSSAPLGDLAGIDDAVLHQVFERLEQTAETEGAKAVAWPFVDAGNEQLLEIARERGYVIVYAGATAIIPICWSSFDEYLTSRSKQVRRSIRSDLAALLSEGLRTTLLQDFQAEADAMDALYRESYRRRNGADPAVVPDLFRRLSRHQSAGIQAHLTWKGERLVGTSINVAGPETLEGTFGAFAEEYHGGPVYYNDLCYEPIRLACAQGIPVLDLGPTALYPKVLRGAVLQRRMTLLRGSNRVTHQLLRAVGTVIGRRKERKERRVLGPLWKRSFSPALTG